MAFSLLPWPFRRRLGAVAGSSDHLAEAERLLEFGVTAELLQFARSLTADTFRSLAAQLEQEAATGGGSDRTAEREEKVRADLSEWQEQHAMLVLSKAKEIAKIRYYLCPRYLKDGEFWKIYFLLVKTYVAPYELMAIRKARLSKPGSKNGEASNGGVVELEMQESNPNRNNCSSTAVPDDSDATT